MRNCNGAGAHAAGQRYAGELAGAQQSLGIGDDRAGFDSAGLGIDAYVGEIDLARPYIFAAVREREPDVELAVLRQPERAVGHRPRELQMLRFGETENHMDRIDLRNLGEQRLLCLHQAAFGLQCAAGVAGDGCLHPRIGKIQAGLGDSRLCALQVCDGNLFGGSRVVIVLLADRAGLEQRLQASRIAFGEI